jgi:periplasmic protein TonB
MVHYKKMKTQRHILTIVLFFWTILLFGQANNSIEKCVSKFDSIYNRTIYTVVDTMPEFPGGNDSLIKFIENNLTWPNDGADFQGTVYISFIVESDGSLTNKTILKGICEHADKEALRLINIMPKWIAGKCKGKTVPVKYVIPLKFIMQ